MRKRIHILSVRDHRKLIVEPDQQWYDDIHSGKYRERFFWGAEGGTPSDYHYFVVDWNVHLEEGKLAYFNGFDAASDWCKQRNAEFPAPPKPAPPPPPFPIGTYYVLDAGFYEIRRITRQQEYGQILGHEQWKRPYLLASGHSGWQEQFIAKYDDLNEALALLHKLIRK
jgi:hypothetical protein